MIQKVQRISTLQLLSKLLPYGKTLAAYQKQNYAVNLYQLKGKKIVGVEQLDNIGDSGYTSLRIIYDDNSKEYFSVYNGSDGDKGKTGMEGLAGDKGASFSLEDMLRRADDALVIVNDNETDDPTKVWSAFRAVEMEKFVNSLSQIVMTDEEYQLLFNEQIFIDLEFTTKSNDNNTLLINSDPVSHKKYVKYWTYEDEAGIDYYILVGDEYHNVNEYYVKIDEDQYKSVSFDIWRDYYLLDYDKDGQVEYFIRNVSVESIPVTRTRTTYEFDEETGETHEVTETITEYQSQRVVTYTPIEYDGIYYTRRLITEVVNEITGDTESHWEYSDVSKPIWLDLEFTSLSEDVKSQLIHSSKEMGDDNYVPSDPSEEEINIIHIPIRSITVDEPNITMTIDSILIKNINIQPVDYLNSPICIEYDENYIKVFEDGRIMALSNNCETSIKIFSEENPNIFAIINITIVTPISSIVFNTSSIKAFKGVTQPIETTINPATASNKNIIWSSSDDEIASVEQQIDEHGNVCGLITLNKEGQVTIYAEAEDGYGAVSRIDVTVDTAVEDIVFDSDNQTTLVYNEETGKYETTDMEDESLTYKTFDTYEVLVGIPTTISFNIEPTDSSNKNVEIETNTRQLSVESTEAGKLTIFASSGIDDINESIVTIKSSYGLPSDSNNGVIEKQILVLVKVPVRNITLDTNTLRLDKGTVYQMGYTINRDANNKTLRWTSSNPNVVSVDNQGTITCLGGGTALITAEATDGSGVKATCSVTSITLIESIELTDISPLTIYVDSNYQLKDIIITPTETNSTIVLESSDTSVFTVNNRVLRGVAEGNAKLYVIANDNSGVIASLDIVVEQKSENLFLSDSELTLNIGENYTLIATLYPDNVTNQFVHFVSEDEDIVIVDLENGYITPVSSGTTKIIVSTIDGTSTAECIININ